MEPAMVSKHQKKYKNMDISEKCNKINIFVFIFFYLGGLSPNVSSVGTPVSSNSCSTPVSKSMITNASFKTKKLPGKTNKFT